MLDYSVTDYLLLIKKMYGCQGKKERERTETREIFLMLAHSITDKNNELSL